MFKFTDEEYKDARWSGLLNVQCDRCGKPYKITKAYVYNIKNFRKHQKTICSPACLKLDRTKVKNSPCKECGALTKRVFCSCSCSAKYNNKNRVFMPSQDTRQKDVKCVDCGDIFKLNIRASLFHKKCNKCKKKKICKCCGTLNCTKKVCRWFLRSNIPEKLGIKVSNIGTERVFEDLLKIRDIFIDLYFEQKLSLPDIKEKTGVWFNSVCILFDFFNLKVRKYSLSKDDRANIRVKLREHTTWDNHNIVLRSSYELAQAKELDKKQVSYLFEPFRIPYISKEGVERFYIPDFYIPSENLLIEIKGSFYVNENDKLKAEAARRMGYKYKYILDGKEVEI